jgi:hypothetical protein
MSIGLIRIIYDVFCDKHGTEMPLVVLINVIVFLSSWGALIGIYFHYDLYVELAFQSTCYILLINLALLRSISCTSTKITCCACALTLYQTHLFEDNKAVPVQITLAAFCIYLILIFSEMAFVIYLAHAKDEIVSNAEASSSFSVFQDAEQNGGDIMDGILKENGLIAAYSQFAEICYVGVALQPYARSKPGMIYINSDPLRSLLPLVWLSFALLCSARETMLCNNQECRRLPNASCRYAVLISLSPLLWFVPAIPAITDLACVVYIVYKRRIKSQS